MSPAMACVGCPLVAMRTTVKTTARPTDAASDGTSAAYALALLVSMLVRWPAIGVIVGFLMGDGTAWRQDKRKMRVAQFLTLVWIGLFVARLLVQVPLYLVDNVAALGVSRLLMGVPLYALVLIFTWLVVRAVYPSSARTPE